MPFVPLAQLDANTLNSIVQNRVPEDRDLDYKREFTKNKDFSVDVSALANAGGGLLLFGIEEGRDAQNRRVPVALKGVNGDPADEILRLEQTARAGIAPPIIGWEWKRIVIAQDLEIVALSIPRTPYGLHMVRDEHRFYSRTSAGNYRMSVEEVRFAFLYADSFAQRIRAFRSERLAAIVANETPTPLGSGPTIVLHIVPYASVDPASQIDVTRLPFSWGDIQPLGIGFDSHRFNLDGLVTWNFDSRDNPKRSYAQFFRRGIVELADAILLGRQSKGEFIPLNVIEDDVLQALSHWLPVLRKASIGPPVYVMLTLLNADGLVVPTHDFHGRYEIDRPRVEIPEIVVDDYSRSPRELLRPMFDALWQTCGLPGSRSYNDAGEWAR